jgi:hypothetical protein
MKKAFNMSSMIAYYCLLYIMQLESTHKPRKSEVIQPDEKV